jgi:hypothetical protein
MLQHKRRGIALDLRKQGLSYQQIADEMRSLDEDGNPKYEAIPEKYSKKVAFNDVIAGLKELSSEYKESATVVRELEAARLDELYAAVYPKAADPNHPEHLYAVDRAIKLAERRGKLLGIDAATLDFTIDLNGFSSEELQRVEKGEHPLAIIASRRNDTVSSGSDSREAETGSGGESATATDSQADTETDPLP